MKKSVELFCGGGGGTEGMKRLGVETVLALDNCECAIETHRLNHPEVPALLFELGGDIEQASAKILEYTGTTDFHLHGSPPCQALSTASKARGNYSEEEGLRLVRWFIELVRYIAPTSWSMENVVGVSDYLDDERLPYFEINSSNYGVPQSRKRIIAGEGFELTPSEPCFSFWAALPHLEREVASGGVRIVSRRRKRGERPQHYFKNDYAHTITRIPHIIEVDEIPYRSLTLSESATLQGWPLMLFPEGYSRKQLMIVIGNMIPPPIFERMEFLT